MSVVFVFFEKNIFECQTKSGKKDDMSGIKRCCWKNDDVENEKKEEFLRKNACWNTRWSRQYDSIRKFAKQYVDSD